MITNTQIATRLIEVAGSATAYFHRLLNEIIDTLNGVSGTAGLATVTPDGSGLAVIQHGYSASGRPASIARSAAFPVGSTAFIAQLVSADASELTVKLFDMAGAPITSGSYSVAWRVGG